MNRRKLKNSKKAKNRDLKEPISNNYPIPQQNELISLKIAREQALSNKKRNR